MYETPKIDVHGMNSEEACNLVSRNIMHFRNRGYPEVFIIHGHGKGILKEKIRAMLRSNPYLKQLRRGSMNEGGDGVTIAVFK